MSTKYRNPASVAQSRVQQLSSQWNNTSFQASSSDSNSSSSGKSSTPEWTSDASTDSDDVNAKVWSQQIHGPGSHKNKMKPGANSESGSTKASQDVTTTHPSSMGSAGDKSSSSGGSDGSDTSNGKPRGPSGKELPGKGLGNNGMGPERYAREEDDSLPAKDTGTPTKDTEKRSDE